MLTATLIRIPLMLLVWLNLPAPTAPCQVEVLTPAAMDARALAQFGTAVEQYVLLHRRLERALPPEQMFDDPEDMFAARDALRTAIIDARPGARQGAFFTPGVGQMIRAHLDAAIAEHHHDPAEILAAINEERLPGMPEPEVNKEYPWGIGSAMWPTLLRALPPLPGELEYRFSDRTLVLIDVHANLVLDILEHALPE